MLSLTMIVLKNTSSYQDIYISIFQLVYIYWLYKVKLYAYKVQNKNTYSEGSDGPEVLCMTERVRACVRALYTIWLHK